MWEVGGQGPLIGVLQLLVLLVGALHHQVADLHVPVDDVVHVEVLVVLAEGVDEHLGDVEPAVVEDELADAEEGDVHVTDRVVVANTVHRVLRAPGDFSETLILVLKVLGRSEILRIYSLVISSPS